jgi:hypothetical protein
MTCGESAGSNIGAVECSGLIPDWDTRRDFDGNREYRSALENAIIILLGSSDRPRSGS